MNRRHLARLRLAAAIGIGMSFTALPADAAAMGGLPAQVAGGQTSGSAGAVASAAAARFGQLPMRFEQNAGQAAAGVRYLSRGHGYSLFLTDQGAVLSLRSDGATSSQAVVTMQPDGASTAPRIVGRDALPGRVNHLLGNDPARWTTDIATFRAVSVEAVYPGIDMLYYGNDQALEYDFIVAPGADPATIGLRFGGVERLELTTDGALDLHTSAGTVRQGRPVAYQDVDGQRRAVESGYIVDGSRVRIALGAYDAGRPLVIDPTVAFATFIGGGDEDVVNGVAVDAAGNVYVTGRAGSTDFPTTPGAFDRTGGTAYDVFVSKLDPTGHTLLYSTYIGGDSIDEGHAIAVDDLGRAYVTGQAWSTTFPRTAGSLQAIGYERSFVSVLAPNGGSFVYSGIFDATSASGIAAYREASTSNYFAYLVGATASNDYPTTANAFDRCAGVADDFGYCYGGLDAFLMKLRITPAPVTPSHLVYSTFLGGAEAPEFLYDDSASAVSVDAAGRASLTGTTQTTDFPVKNPIPGGSARRGPNDAFVARIDPSASGAASLLFSSYLGGTGSEAGRGIDVDASSNSYVTGATWSTDFPTTAGALDRTCGNTGVCDPVGGVRTADGFVTKISPAGNALAYSTYLGGHVADEGTAIALDAANNAWITGATSSDDFPLKDAIVRIRIYLDDVFTAKLNAAGSALLFSSYFGSTGNDASNAIAVDAAGNAYLGGAAMYDDFPWTRAAFDPVCGPSDDGCGVVPDGFVMKISPPALSDRCPDHSPALTASAARSADPHQVIVKFRPGTSRAAAGAAIASEGARTVHQLDLIRAQVVRSGERSALELARAFARRVDVQYVSLDFIRQAMDYPGEPKFRELWGLHNTGQVVPSTSTDADDLGIADVDIDGLEASRITLGDPSVVVAVIDTGVDLTHPDLAGREWRNPGESGGGKETNGRDDDANGYIDDVFGWDFANNDKTVYDGPSDEHGTHVAGTIAANINGQGGVGVAPNTKVMALKFLTATGGTDSNAIRAIQYAARAGVRISNNSWGGGDCNPALKAAIQAASGMLFVAAAGNGGVDGLGDNTDISLNYPSSYDVATVVSVASVDNRGRLASSSNWGYRNVDLAAPGVNIFSTLPAGAYGFLNGTSMASPHVAGVAALARSVNKALGPVQLRQLLLDTGMPLASLKDRTATGRMVNAKGAVDRAMALDTTPPVAAAPVAALVQDSQLGASAVPVRLSWGAATDAGTGVVRYELSQSTDGGATYAVIAVLAPTVLTQTRQLEPSATTSFRYRIRAQDRRGNWSGYATGVPFKVLAYQETPRATAPTIAYGAGWIQTNRVGAYGGAVRTSTTVGANATFTFNNGNKLGLVMPLRSDLGVARICLFAGPTQLSCGNLDLSPATGVGPRKIVFVRNQLVPTTTYRLVVTVASGRVDLDAFVIIR